MTGKTDIRNELPRHTGLSRRVIEYSLAMKSLVDAAHLPGFSGADCAELASFVDPARFERVGNFKEVMDWPAYAAFLVAWAPTAQWECSFRRVSECGTVVFLELEERTRTGDFSSVVNSLSVYEFGEDGRITHLDIYLQMPMPDPAMLAGYEGIEISG